MVHYRCFINMNICCEHVKKIVSNRYVRANETRRWYLIFDVMNMYTLNRRVFHDYQPYVIQGFRDDSHPWIIMNLFQTLATGTSTKVKEWLLEAGLIIELDGLGAKIIGKAPFLVVTWMHFGKRGMTFWCFFLFFSEPKNWSFKWNIYALRVLLVFNISIEYRAHSQYTYYIHLQRYIYYINNDCIQFIYWYSISINGPLMGTSLLKPQMSIPVTVTRPIAESRWVANVRL